ncbi:MAG: YbdD/YjiX family protein [Candidatus Acidiferrales bacterium]
MNARRNARTNPLKKLWWWLRQISGDAAYENYLAHRCVSPQERDTAAMTRDEFYADSLRRKYSTINRCC